MSRGKNCLPTVPRQFLTRNYPRPNCLLKCLPNCLSPTKEGFLPSFKINPAVRVIARQVRDKNCLAAIFAPRHQSVSSGPLGSAVSLSHLLSQQNFWGIRCAIQTASMVSLGRHVCRRKLPPKNFLNRYEKRFEKCSALSGHLKIFHRHFSTNFKSFSPP